MAKFMLLIVGDPTDFSSLSPAEAQAHIEDYSRFAARLREENRLVDAEGLDDEAKVLRRSAQGVTVTDGPFAETKEVVGGYYVFEAADWAEAERIAHDCPGLKYGATLELRKVMDYGN